MTTAPDKHTRVAEMIDRIEAEMKRIGFWCKEPPTPEQMRFKKAFAMDTMAYQQWVQFVLLPRARDIVESRGSFPPKSNTGIQAIRAWDGDDRASALTTMLCDFDRLIEGGG
ncbi:MAG: YqcC family protein [Planctomycetota bacterium]